MHLLRRAHGKASPLRRHRPSVSVSSVIHLCDPVMIVRHAEPPAADSADERSLSGRLACCLSWVEGGYEAIAKAGHGGNETWHAPVVLQACPQVTNLTVYNIALGDESTPHSVSRISSMLTTLPALAANR
jgi:hypothetical protein